MTSAGVSGTNDVAQLLGENEQLRTTLEAAIEENARVVEDRDRLMRRVAVLGHELRTLRVTAPSRGGGGSSPSALADVEARARQSQTDEELRVAFEELQVLTEELEVANSSLNRANSDLEERVSARTRELSESNRILRRIELRLSTLVNGIPQLVWRSQDRGLWTWAGEQWSNFTGLSDEQSRGTGWLEAFHPDDRPGIRAAWERAAVEGGFTYEGRIRPSGSGHFRHFQTQAAPVRAADGTVLEWLGTCTDVEDLFQLREQQSVLVGELQHRTRNLMAVVQAVVMRTIRSSTSLPEFRSCVSERLDALARVQGLLSRRGSQRVAFDVLLREELSAHVELDEDGNGAQVCTEGPTDIPLESSLVQTFALALHELATNAVKYGALSTPTGKLWVTWEVDTEAPGECRLHVDWLESGVEMPYPDQGAKGGGYGRELIERALPYQLGAATTYCFTNDGVHCTIDVDVRNDHANMEMAGG